jgi:hypothetical protein
VSPSGDIAGRYSPMVTPDDAALVSDIEANLPA